MKELFYNERIYQKAFLTTDKIPFTEKAASYCKANKCGRYGTTWNCPPAAGTYEELKAKAVKYKNAFVFSHKGVIEDFSDEQAIDSLRNETMDILFCITSELKEKNIGHFALGCGSCNYCKECTYPHSPCRFPERALPSVEACGIDVSQLCRITDMVYFADKNEVTFFCIILY